MSLRESAPVPRTCSGDMYFTVPMMMLEPLTPESPGVSRRERASPKSSTFTSPSAPIIMFGLDVAVHDAGSEPLPQGLAGHILLGDEIGAIGVAGVV
jgi:hypothetical protein